MTSYAGLDVSRQATRICVIADDGEVLFEGKCGMEPKEIAETLKRHAPALKRAVLETGSMSGWLTEHLGVVLETPYSIGSSTGDALLNWK